MIINHVCIFCLRHHDNIAEPTKQTCTYGMHHEFPVADKPKQVAQPSKALCTRCGLHPKNPASSVNGCEHTYAV